MAVVYLWLVLNTFSLDLSVAFTDYVTPSRLFAVK